MQSSVESNREPKDLNEFIYMKRILESFENYGNAFEGIHFGN